MLETATYVVILLKFKATSWFRSTAPCTSSPPPNLAKHPQIGCFSASQHPMIDMIFDWFSYDRILLHDHIPTTFAASELRFYDKHTNVLLNLWRFPISWWSTPPTKWTNVQGPFQKEAGSSSSPIILGELLGFGKDALPETNSSPLKIDPWKRRFLWDTTIFRGELLVFGKDMLLYQRTNEAALRSPIRIVPLSSSLGVLGGWHAATIWEKGGNYMKILARTCAVWLIGKSKVSVLKLHYTHVLCNKIVA